MRWIMTSLRPARMKSALRKKGARIQGTGDSQMEGKADEVRKKSDENRSEAYMGRRGATKPEFEA